ncbi:cytochrome P450 [Streptomyces sp. NPDC058572]|uniref:cytochrome P450 family protein n=1 Tax=Streptomyces sp. NPDC058572 TaxID=3346546 RepID=UPI0036689C76
MSDLVIHQLPADIEQRRDPYPWLDRLRRAGPVQRVELRGGGHAWMVTRYDDVMAAVAHPSLSSDPRTPGSAASLSARPGGDGRRPPSMLTTDPPDHTRLRQLVSRAFTPRRVAALRPRMQQIADALIDEVAPLGRADLVADFALPLPVAVICELLGVPFEDRGQFGRWSTDMLSPPVAPAAAAAAEQARADLGGYLAGLVARKRAEPADDLLTALAAAAEENRLSDAELVGTAVLLLVAGHETTVSLIGTGTLLLLLHPGQLGRLRREPALLPSAVEEFLRYDGPVMLGVVRYAREDLNLAGTAVAAGETVVLSTGAANRDPGRFDRPDVLDIARAHNPHLALGHGLHYCLGAALARLEGQIAIGTLLRRLPALALAVDEEAVRRRPSVIRGLATLPVTFTPTALPPDRDDRPHAAGR